MTHNADHFEGIESSLLFSSVSIIESSNPLNEGKSGLVVNVTKNMIILKNLSLNRIFKIAKNEVLKYCLTTTQGRFIIPGKRLLGRPEEVKGKIR